MVENTVKKNARNVSAPPKQNRPRKQKKLDTGVVKKRKSKTNLDRSNRNFNVNNGGLTEQEIDAFLNRKLPLLEEVEKGLKYLTWYFQPSYYGTANLDTNKPSLFIGNHSLMAVPDAMAILGIYRAGIQVRGMADRFQFKYAFLRRFHEKMGSVIGDRALCDAMMSQGQNILVFPGGTREVLKKHREIHSLVWKKRLGFIRLAIRNNYPILPFSVVGGDEVFNILADSDDYLKTSLGKFLDQKGILDKYLRGKDELPPLVRGIGPTIFPKPQKIYVNYGQSINLSSYRNKINDDKAMFEARDLVANSIQQLMIKGMELQRSDGSVSIVRRLLNSL